jgi:predicted nucleic acid-binding protein
MILIDSNILLDINSRDPVWLKWSLTTLARCTNESQICINPIIYAEASVRFESTAEFDEAWPTTQLERTALPYAAAFLAGKAHAAYRRRGGRRVATLPDFFIGAHAAVSKYKLLTRDPRRIRQYFPAVELICP